VMHRTNDTKTARSANKPGGRLRLSSNVSDQQKRHWAKSEAVVRSLVPVGEKESGDG